MISTLFAAIVLLVYAVIQSAPRLSASKHLEDSADILVPGDYLRLGLVPQVRAPVLGANLGESILGRTVLLVPPG
jgi:hypothetical protein